MHYPTEKSYLDIGANFGLRSIYYASQGRECYLFEPNKKCNVITQRLIEENNFTNVHLVPKIVGNTNSIQKFYLSKSTYVSTIIKERSNIDNDFTETIEEEQITVDDFVTQHHIADQVAILKIDVEGYEYAVLLGARKLLAKPNKTFIMEVLFDSTEKSNIFQFLLELNYKFFYILSHPSKLILELLSERGFKNKAIDVLCTNDVDLINILSEKYIVRK